MFKISYHFLKKLTTLLNEVEKELKPDSALLLKVKKYNFLIKTFISE